MLIKFAIKDFLEDRDLRNVTNNTIKGYLHVLGEFENHCLRIEIIDISKINARTVKSYLIYCKNERNNNPTSLNSKLRVIKSFFNYLEEIEVITLKTHPSKKVSFIKEDIKIDVFSDYHITQMLNFYRRIRERNNTYVAYRDYMIIVFFLGTGVRSAELINLKWSDVDLIYANIIVNGKKDNKVVFQLLTNL